jgi:diphthamide biosynthesis protein 2
MIGTSNFAHSRVLVQLPNDMLHESKQVLLELKSKFDTVVLGEHKCCLETINHTNHEFIIHYGQSCLSHTNQKFQLVFKKSPIDLSRLVAALDTIDGIILLLCDVDYYHIFDELNMPKLIKSRIKTSYLMEMAQEFQVQGRYYDCKDTKGVTVVYIGNESLCLTSLIMAFQENSFFNYDPLKEVLVQSSGNVLLKRRYFLVQKAKVANVFGIIVGSSLNGKSMLL